MYCVVLIRADGRYEREFINYLPTSADIRELEGEHSVYVTIPCGDYYNNTERKPAKIVNLFKIGGDEDE